MEHLFYDENGNLDMDYLNKSLQNKKNRIIEFTPEPDTKEDNKKEEPKYIQTENGKTIKLLLENFKCFKEEAKSYPSWFPLLCAIWNSVEDKEEGLALAHQFSKLNNYDEDGVNKIWDKFENSEPKKTKTIGSLIYLAKKEDDEKYKTLFAKKKENKKLLEKIEKKEIKESIEKGEKELEDLYEDRYHRMEKEHEKNHLKIINKSYYIKHTDENYIIMSESQLITSYRHLSYGKDKNDNRLSFIMRWIANNDAIRCKLDVGIFPNPSKCPKNIFNLWTPFAMSLIKEYNHKEEELQIILNHIKILCGNHEETYNHFILWIAQMLQCPDVKTCCPFFISKMGAGKGTLMKLIENMIGSHKYLETSDPSRDVWGQFNENMGNCFFVNLDELNKKQIKESEDKYKALVTNGALMINPKGKTSYKLVSHHRFLVTTNGEDWEVNRRNWIIRASDEKINDKVYFKNLRDIIEDVDVVKTCFEYFMNIEGTDKFNEIPIPETEYQNELKEANRPIIEQWLYDFVIEHNDQQEVILLGKDIFTHFCSWKDKNKIPFEMNAIKIALKIKQLKLEGISKGIPTNKGNPTIFYIPLLKKHFGIGCLIKIEEKDDEGK